MILGNVLGSVRFSNYLPEEEVGEIIMRLQQYYDVHFTEATYYVQKQMFYFNFVEDNSAIVRVFPLEDYYKLDPDNKMETYKFGIIYINEEDKFQMQEIDTAFDYIPDETNDSVIYTKDTTPISVGVKPVKFCEENAETTKAILAGKETGAKRDIVLLNAGAAIYCAGIADTLAEGIEKAKESIDSGKALEVLNKLVEFTNR